MNYYCSDSAVANTSAFGIHLDPLHAALALGLVAELHDLQYKGKPEVSSSDAGCLLLKCLSRRVLHVCNCSCKTPTSAMQRFT
jgi:hypothetical protein